MTDADRFMSRVEEHQPVPWEQFGELLAERGEMDVGAVQLRRFEDSTVPPGPSNDVMVAGDGDRGLACRTHCTCN
jgi:hypothetical protein